MFVLKFVICRCRSLLTVDKLKRIGEFTLAPVILRLKPSAVLFIRISLGDRLRPCMSRMEGVALYRVIYSMNSLLSMY